MIPEIESFNCHGDPSTVSQNWEKWKKSFEYFLAASGINDDARKKALLLHMAGRETQEVYETLVVAENTYTAALAALNTHFTAKKNVPFERANFHSAKQLPSESIDEYVIRLRKLSEFCEYDGERDNEIRDQLVASCLSKRFRKKLLEKADLTLTTAIEMGQLMESVAHQTDAMDSIAGNNSKHSHSSNNDDTEYMNYLDWRRNQDSGDRQENGCSRCGHKGHSGKDCRRSRNTKCGNCGKMGHWKKMCRTDMGQNPQQQPQQQRQNPRPQRGRGRGNNRYRSSSRGRGR